MADTTFTYSIAPPASFVSRTINVVVTATNDTDGEVTFTDSDQILIIIPPNMVQNYNFSGAATEGSGFSVDASGEEGTFAVTRPFGSKTLKQGDAITVTFSQVPIGASETQTNVSIEETLGEHTASNSLKFDVQTEELNVIAWFDKDVVGDLETTNLNWQSSSGSKLHIIGFPTEPVDREMPLQGKTPVYVPGDSTNGFHPYVVRVTAGNESREQIKNLYLSAAVIDTFSSTPPAGSISPAATVNLTWHVQYASSIFLSTPTIPNWRQRNSEDLPDVAPGSDLAQVYKNAWSQLPSKAEYMLTANGYKGQQQEKLTFDLQQIKLLYFKYKSKENPVVVSAVDPESWIGVERGGVGSDVETLTIHQPGGVPSVYYLGAGDTTHPQIPYFYCTKNADNFDIQWETANLKTLTLNGEAIPEGELKEGCRTVPAGTYTLVGTAENGEKVNSVLDTEDCSS